MGKPSLKWSGISFGNQAEKVRIPQAKSAFSKLLKALGKLSDEELSQLTEAIAREIASRGRK